MLRRFLSAVLYTGALLAANAAAAQDIAAAEAARDGTMKKLIFAAPAPVTAEAFTLENGGTATLADYEGKWVLLNFWATWCAPCRKEMPMLDALQRDYGGDDFEVLTIATGRNSPQGMAAFFEEIGVEALPLHVDPSSAMARSMAVLGLPVTVVIDPEGREIARMRGDADWDSDSARAAIEALLGREAES